MVLDGRPTLHSNLVIFKSKSRRSKTGCFYLYIPIWLYSNSTAQKPKTHIVKSFTFQSGYIQIDTYIDACFIKVFFTFQSGYIQIGCAMIKSHLFTVLYIPIWLYSNSAHPVKVACSLRLYIPIWLYSNG